jgi:hypothetical protein
MFHRKPMNRVYKVIKVGKDIKRIKKATKATIKYNLTYQDQRYHAKMGSQ